MSVQHQHLLATFASSEGCRKSFPMWHLNFVPWKLLLDSGMFQHGSCYVCTIGRAEGHVKYPSLSLICFEEGVYIVF